MRLANVAAVNRDLEKLAWESWTPTYSAALGGSMTVTTNNAVFHKIGKIVFYNIVGQITNKGSADLAFIITLPTAYPGLGRFEVGCGFESTLTGNMLVTLAGTTTLLVYKYNFATFIATNASFNLTGWYKIA